MTTNAQLKRNLPKSGSVGQRQAAVLVTGPGRSGTSAVTRGMQALGVELGDRLRAGSGKNPTGFFEDLDFLSLSKRLRNELGLNSGSIRFTAPAEWESPGVRALEQEAVDTIRRRFSGVPLWGFKYARSLRFLPFWEAVLSEVKMDLYCVLVLRNPLSVARSRGQINPQRGQPAWNSLEWLMSVAPYLHHLRQHRFVVVDFDALLDDPAAQLERIARNLQLTYGEEQRKAVDEYAKIYLRPGMPRGRFSMSDLDGHTQVHKLVTRTYVWLNRLAHDEVAADDESIWMEWTQIRAAIVELTPLLAHLDELRDQLNRAQWNPASILQSLGQVWRNWRSR